MINDVKSNIIVILLSSSILFILFLFLCKVCNSSTGGILEKTKILKSIDDEIVRINSDIHRSTQELEALTRLVPQTKDSFKMNIMFILKYKLNKNVKNFKKLMTTKNEAQIEILSRQTKSKDSISSTLRQRSSTRKVIPGIDFNESSTSSLDETDVFGDTAANLRVQSQESLFYVERENKMKQIEKGMTKLQGVFSQMASLVYEQGEMLSRIDHNIDTTVLYVDDTHTRLHKQLKLLKNNRGRIIKIFVILIAVLIIYVLFFL